MFKTMDIMKEEKLPISGCQSIHSTFNGYAINNTSLRLIICAKITTNMFLCDVCHQLVE